MRFFSQGSREDSGEREEKKGAPTFGLFLYIPEQRFWHTQIHVCEFWRGCFVCLLQEVHTVALDSRNVGTLVMADQDGASA